MNQPIILPLEWDMEAVREFYADKGLDFDKLGPRNYVRFHKLGDPDPEGDNFYQDFAAFLERRSKN